MALTTASAIISLARKLEQESAKLYESLAAKHPRGAEVFLAFARENARNVQQVERTYYSVISDAIEGGFAFDLDESRWALDPSLADASSLSGAVARATTMEEHIAGFYSEAAAQSKGLLADVPKAFVAVARKRSGRAARLQALLGSG